MTHPLTGKTGADHPRWATELDAAGALRRVTRLRGRAGDQLCRECSRRARYWVPLKESPARRSQGNRHWSMDADDYVPLCRRHRDALSPDLEHYRELGIVPR